MECLHHNNNNIIQIGTMDMVCMCAYIDMLYVSMNYNMEVYMLYVYKIFEICKNV